MVISELANVSGDIVSSVGKIGLWLQAIGIIVIIYVIFHIISWIYNMRRMKEIKVIKEDMVRIEEKIDSLLERKGK